MNNLLDLSIDFDYFCYEDPIWDWGHNEENDLFRKYAWIARYLYHQEDLQKIITLDEADFQPCDILERLSGYNIQNQAKTLTVVNSHALAGIVLANSSADTLLSFDAHIDYWPREGDLINCANWMRFVTYETILNVIPSFVSYKDYSHRPENSRSGHITQIFGDISKYKEYKLNNIFVCKSSDWVPPHMDRYFIEMVQFLEENIPDNCSISIDEDNMIDRMDNRIFKDLDVNREKYQKIEKDLKDKYNAI